MQHLSYAERRIQRERRIRSAKRRAVAADCWEIFAWFVAPCAAMVGTAAAIIASSL